MDKDPNDMSFKEHAIAWWIEKGYIIPLPDSPEWEEMYAEWVDFAFKDM